MTLAYALGIDCVNVCSRVRVCVGGCVVCLIAGHQYVGPPIYCTSAHESPGVRQMVSACLIDRP